MDSSLPIVNQKALKPPPGMYIEFGLIGSWNIRGLIHDNNIIISAPYTLCRTSLLKPMPKLDGFESKTVSGGLQADCGEVHIGVVAHSSISCKLD
mmetsp:Transcript_29980/g.44281  ORF Transcript_29980/g.44281 Transcript_29980/m.44281 type:complete len:95 (+) Transcript_29980:604-888(+)